MSNRKQEVVDKAKALVVANFGGDYKAAFNFYDSDKDGAITIEELSVFLRDAGVGNFLTRNAWSQAAIAALDVNRDGKIQWEEFSAALAGENSSLPEDVSKEDKDFDVGGQG